MDNVLFISCPCCGEKIKIQIDSSGNSTAFLLDRKPISQSDLSRHGIELGIVEGGEYKNEQ